MRLHHSFLSLFAVLRLCPSAQAGYCNELILRISATTLLVLIMISGGGCAAPTRLAAVPQLDYLKCSSTGHSRGALLH